MYPSSCAEFNNNMGEVCNNIRTINKHSNIILLGDLNLPDVCWETFSSNILVNQGLCDI